LRQDSENEKPWTSIKAKPPLTKLDFPAAVDIVRANMLYIEKSGISSPALNSLKRLAAFSNPEFYKNQAMRKSTFNTPRVISCSDETEDYICLPRGLEDEVISFFAENGVNTSILDET
jgi:hypothetical protein